MASVWALLTLVIVVLALMALIAIPIITTHLESRRDCRKIMAPGVVGQGIVTKIGRVSRYGQRTINFNFQLDSSGRTVEGSQKATAAAIDLASVAVGSTVQLHYLPKSPSSAFIDSLTLPGHIKPGSQLGLIGAADHTAQPAFFVVTYSDPTKSAFATGKPTNSYRWIGSGSICVTVTSVRFTANRARPFWVAKPVEVEFALNSIANVEQYGEAVTLEIVEPESPVKPVKFWAVRRDEAKRIAELLPRAKTDAFTPKMAEFAAFQARLLELTPRAPVTPALVAVNVLMFVVAGVMGAGFLMPHPDVLVRLGSNYTPLTVGGEWWRLLTSTFLHFGLAHLAFNMFALYANGVFAERLFGSARFIVIYLVAGLSGSLASLFWHPIVNAAGASGAIFGVLGALVAVFIRTPGGIPASVTKAQRTSALLFIFYNLMNGARVANIDNAAHVGGLVGGFVMGLLLMRPLDARRTEQRWTGQWAIVTAVLCGAALICARLIAGGTLAPRAAHDERGNPIPLEVLAGPIQTFGRVRIGMSADEVLQARGEPYRRDGASWLYNTIDDAHDGLLEVRFEPGASGSQSVGAVVYVGEHGGAPGELPYLVGLTVPEVAHRYGEPVAVRPVAKGSAGMWYRNGVVAFTEEDVIHRYGVFDLRQLP